MLLNVLLSILTATYSLNSTTSVELTGSAPSSSEVVYERSATSGQKGQMTNGNSTQLTLKGWDGCTIKEVILQMRSNTTSGAGTLTMKLGTDTLWSIDNKPFDDDQWAGKYTTEWTDIRKRMIVKVAQDEEIMITISAQENSLYIDSYTILYEVASAQTYSVDFITGLDTCPLPLYQNAPNSAIVLPSWQDTACWYFLGWTEEEVVEGQLITPILYAGHEYVPKRNTKLWAVYSDVKENTAITEYVSGQYLVAMNKSIDSSTKTIALSGEVVDNVIPIEEVEITKNESDIFCLQSAINDNLLYDIIFNDDGTLTMTYVKTGKSIGYSGTKLTDDNSVWQYKVLDDGSIVIYSDNQNTIYALYIGQPNGSSMCGYMQKISLDKWKNNALWFFPYLEVQYTSWPFGKFEGVDNIFQSHAVDGVFHIGIYELHIQNGQKILYIR